MTDAQIYTGKAPSSERESPVTVLLWERTQLGQAALLRLNRQEDTCRDTILWTCGSFSGIVAEKTGQTEIPWTAPVELAQTAPEDTEVTVRFAVTTYLGEETLGTAEQTGKWDIPENLIPTVEAEIRDAAGYAQSWGYLQGLSQLEVEVQAAGCYGAEIRRILITCGKSTGTGERWIFPLTDAGQIPFSVSVWDSRGRKGRLDGTVAVQPYSPPVGAILSAQRCTQAGTPAPEGAWCSVTARGYATDLQGHNPLKLVLRYEKAGEDGAKTCLLSDGACRFPAAPERGYNLTLLASDRFQTVETDAASVPMGFLLLDVCRESRALGLAAPADIPAGIRVGLPMHLSGQPLHGVGAPEEGTDGVNLAYVEDMLGSSGNGIFRGKNLGERITAAQYAEVASGSFRGLYVGDFWRINNIVWRIAGFNWLLGLGDIPCRENHLVLIPDAPLFQAPMTAGSWESGYPGTDMFCDHLNAARTQAQNAFPGHVLEHRIPARVSGKTQWCSAVAELLWEDMLGLPLFWLEPRFLRPGSWWLADTADKGSFLCMGTYGEKGAAPAGESHGVRPYVCLRGTLENQKEGETV